MILQTHIRSNENTQNFYQICKYILAQTKTHLRIQLISDQNCIIQSKIQLKKIQTTKSEIKQPE